MKIIINPSSPRTFRIRFNDDETRIESSNFISAITTYLQSLTPDIEIELQQLPQLTSVMICWMYDENNIRQMFLIQDITSNENVIGDITLDVAKLQAISADVAALATKHIKRGRPKNTADQNLARDFKQLARSKRRSKSKRRRK